MSELDLDAIEAMITEFNYSGVLRWPHAERVKLGLEIAKKAPALVARVRELEGECNRMGEILLDRGCDKVVSELVATHDLLTRVLAESGGDGERAALSHRLIDEITEAI